MNKTAHDLLIVGAGGFGRELFAMLWEVFDPGTYRFKGFLADEVTDLDALGVQAAVLGDPESYEPDVNDRLLLAIGSMDVRRRVVEALEAKGGQFLNFIHPRAYVAPSAELGRGAVVYPFAVVSNRSVLQPHVHLSYYASIGHDCQIGSYCLLAPYATLNGFVTLDSEVYISTHASVAPGRSVGYRSKLSSNSACMQDVAAEMLVFGVPGRQVRRID